VEVMTTAVEEDEVSGSYDDMGNLITVSYKTIGGVTQKVVTRTRINEADKLSVPEFPSIAQVKAWMIQLAYNLVAAGRRTDQAEIRWIYQVQKEGATFEQFGADSCTQRFKNLDVMLGVAMYAMIKKTKKPIAEDVLIKMDTIIKGELMLTGRQFVWMMLDYFKTNHSLEQVHNITDLQEIVYPGDKNMHRFRTVWHLIVNNFRKPVDDETLGEILYKKIKGSDVLREDIYHYNNAAPGTETHSYQFLLRAMDRYLSRKSMEEQLVARDAAYKAASKAPGGAALESATPAKGEKGKGKGKGKGEKGKKGEKGGGKGGGGGNAVPRAQSTDAQRVCKWFQTDSCRWGDQCRDLHVKISQQNLQDLARSQGKSITNANANGTGGSPGAEGKGGGKGKGGKGKDKGKKGKATPGVADFAPPPAPFVPDHCQRFLTEKSCHDTNCAFSHVTRDVVEEHKRARMVRKAAAKAAAQAS